MLAGVRPRLSGNWKDAMAKAIGDDGLQGELHPGVQAERAGLADLDPVVGEADRAEAGEQPEGQHGAGGRRGPGDQVRDRVGQQHADDDDDAAHGGRATLGVVAGGTVVADELAVALLHEEPDGVAGAEQGAKEADATGEQDASHSRSPSGAIDSCSATDSKAKPREAFTSTTSAGRSHAAAAAVGGVPVDGDRSRRRSGRHRRRGRQRGHRRRSAGRRRVLRPAHRPRWWAVGASGPSSSMSPSTASSRPSGRRRDATVRSAAAMESGFAL